MQIPLQLTTGAAVIRPLLTADWPMLLRLNADNRPAVAALDESGLTHLLDFGGHHLVAVDRQDNVLGYLLSFPRGSAYDDSEINRLRLLVPEPFFYICQVVIAREHRRQQVGRRLYDAVTEAARQSGARALCVDVNTDPPNPESFSFHFHQGFAKIGEGISSDGPAVAFLAKRL